MLMEPPKPKAKVKEILENKNTRYGLLALLPVVVLCVIGVRLFFVQIIDHDKYVAEASSQRVKQTELIAKRGEIYMMSGEDGVTPVVMNERTWTIFIDPSYVADKDKVQSEVSNILGDQMITDWSKVWSNMKNMYVEVAKNVNYDTVSKIKAANLRGVGQKETSKRVYPAGELASQVLGFVNAEGVGTGVEGSLNDKLSGTNGLLKSVTDVNDIPLSIGDDNIEIAAKDGEDVVLTLDENIQHKVERILQSAMANNSGISAASALVMDPNTGKIYAMANYPTYNPEQYWKVTDSSVYTNRTTESPYEPASVCKTFTYATALNENAISLSDTYVNTGKTVVADRTIHNATSSNPHTGTLTFQSALDFSLNTGSVEVLRRMGGGDITKATRTKLYDYLHNDFGLGQKTGVELYEESGTIISPEETEGNAVRYANMTFGQGMNLTMVQVASGFSSIINGGKYYQPTIVAGTMQDGKLVKAEQKAALRQTISASTSATMRKALREVRSVNGGKYDPAGYYVGVKTGTAETYDENGNYTSDKTVASVIGFGGTGKDDAMPQYVVMVRLDGNRLLWGSINAVPIFTEISNYMIEYLRVAPNI